MKKHHADLIKIWADDDTLIAEFLTPGGKWAESPNGPNFIPSVSYRLRDTDTGMIISFSSGLKKPVKEKEVDYNVTF